MHVPSLNRIYLFGRLAAAQVATIYRGADNQIRLDIVGVSSTDVHNFGPVIHLFRRPGGAPDRREAVKIRQR